MTITDDYQYQDRMATAFDEMGVLDEMGKQGWEMTGFGPLVLHFRRPADPAQRKRIEYLRPIELFGFHQRTVLQRNGWIYCGSWGFFHYFMRPEQSADTSTS